MRLAAGELPPRQPATPEASATERVSEPIESTTERKPSPRKKQNTTNSDHSGYVEKFLRPLKGEATQKGVVVVPDSLHTQLKRIVNLVFDGKVSIAALVTNIIRDHINTYSDLYDTLYQQPKSWNE